MRYYTLQDFLEYPSLAFRLAAVAQPRGHSVSYGIGLWFIFGAANLIYQNFGMLIYLLVPQVRRANAADAAEEVPLLARISETGSIMCLTLVGVCKMCILFWHGARIAALMQEFEQLFPSVEWQELQANLVASGGGGRAKRQGSGDYRLDHFARSSNRLMKFTTVFFIFAFCFYNALPIVQFVYELLSPERQLSYRYQSNTWYPWQTEQNNKSPLTFIAAYLCQLQSSLTGVAFIMAGEFMLCFFITQMQLHFDFLANALHSLDASGAGANQQLELLVDYHNRLLNLSKEINNIFAISFLVNFTTSSIAICLMGFSMVSISVAHACKYSVGLLSFLIFTLFVCYNGSEFTAASERLSPAAFCSNWYKGNIAHRRMILFIIMRCQRPTVLRAYKFTVVSMQTYMVILKFSYQLFTLLRARG